MIDSTRPHSYSNNLLKTENKLMHKWTCGPGPLARSAPLSPQLRVLRGSKHGTEVLVDDDLM